MKSKTTTMFTIALTIAVIGGSMAIPAMLTQYADAKYTCNTDPDGSALCKGGQGYDTEGISGGSGQRLEYDASDNTFTRSGGGGGNFESQVGGVGTHTSCEPNVTCNSDSTVGGSGVHTK